MERKQIVDLLASITTHLKDVSPKERMRVEDLQKSLAQVLLTQDIPIKMIQPELLTPQVTPIATIDKERIKHIVDQARPLEEGDQMHVEIRTSDFKVNIFRDAKKGGVLKNVVPSFMGVRKIKTEGPFVAAGGLDFTFDYFPYFTKLNTLYIEGQTLPALLFKTRTLRFPIELPTPIPFPIPKGKEDLGKLKDILSKGKEERILHKVKGGIPLRDPKIRIPIKNIKIPETIRIKSPKDILEHFPKNTRLYQVVGNTVWVRANLLSPSAPSGHYCGLRVKDGTLLLDKLPTSEVKNKITVSKTTTITANFNLVQKDAEIGNDSIFGLDAKNAEYQLPVNFSFRIKDSQKTILTVSDIDCKVYGNEYLLKYENSQDVGYNDLISSVTIPIKNKDPKFSIQQCESALVDISGEAPIKNSYWALLSNPLDIQKPLEADSNGVIIFECGNGLSANIKNTDDLLSLSAPFIFLLPQGILFIDQESNGEGFQHNFDLWEDNSKSLVSTGKIKYRKKSPLYYTSDAQGEENLVTLTDVRLNVDRPVKVNGEPVTINTKSSITMFNGKDKERSISIIDFDVLNDNMEVTDPKDPKFYEIEPISFALQNALLTVTPPMAVSLMGKYNEDFKTIKEAQLITRFGVFNYIPTLPDPYAANLGILKRENPRDVDVPFGIKQIILYLNNVTTWKEDTEVSTFFEFLAPNNSQQALKMERPKSESANNETNEHRLEFQKILSPIDDSGSQVKEGSIYKTLSHIERTVKKPNQTINLIYEILSNLNNTNRFSLLDVSSNANQMGVSFKPYKKLTRQVYTGGDNGDWSFPLKIVKLDVVAQGIDAQVFMLPQISWEPLFNLSKPAAPVSYTEANDPPQGFNYYPNDGLPTFIGNYGKGPVALSPIPLSKYLVDVYDKGKITYALFNLPFGMFGLTILDKSSGEGKAATIKKVAPEFKENVNGGIQLELTAGSSFAAEGDLFQGFTIQLANVQDMAGQQNNYSTLGSSVHQIFGDEFGVMPENPDDASRPAVPLERIGLSGYGASIFSDWHNKNATFAATSQATFNVATGRTMQEVVQVKSVIYPWGIFVVRTITILRLSSGYIARLDSGWQAESDGKFYYGIKGKPNPYEMHAGLIHGLYNIRNIRENELVYTDQITLNKGDTFFNTETNKEEIYDKNSSVTKDVLLRGLTFDADIEIEGAIEGQDKDNRVPSKGVLGFVQLRPRGTAITPEILSNLLTFQNGSIGGPVNCTIKIANTEQYMKIDRVDVNNSTNESDAPIFVAAARGSVILPKEGSWTMITHKASDGTVTPLDTNMSVPLIRIGKWDLGKLVNNNDLNNLQRIAHPSELLCEQGDLTINFGFLQNLDTQKVLFLTPSFKKGVDSLLSKTPPLMADGYRLLNSKGIFPNIGDAVHDFGDAVQLLNANVNGTIDEVFAKAEGIKDGAKDVYELLKIASNVDAGKLVDQGYELLNTIVEDGIKKVLNFEIPDVNYNLIDTENFKIRIDYKADGKESKLDYTIDSFANDLEDQWRGRLNNLSMVVSLGPFDDLMTVMGNFNNEKGKESNFGGEAVTGEGALPTPKIVFSDAVKPVLQVLEILEKLSTEDYAGVLKKGLQVAMSNNANIWEYKYEAKKEIGLIRFPLAPLYDSPQTPLKLEASLSLGFYFNAALKVTTDPKDLLPTAGAFFMFHGGLQVMCVSVAAATIYAIGNADLKISADTSPSLAVDMKFGFGAQLAVGLPVIGNVSIEFMMSIEVHADTGNNVAVTAIMMFRGHAELFGGVVGVTITIEAKGAIEKSGAGPTNCRASVSFGLDISVAFFIDISFYESWEETRQIA